MVEIYSHYLQTITYTDFVLVKNYLPKKQRSLTYQTNSHCILFVGHNHYTSLLKENKIGTKIGEKYYELLIYFYIECEL